MVNLLHTGNKEKEVDARGIGRRTFRYLSVSAVGKCVGDNFGVLSPVLTFRYNFNPFGVKFDRLI